MSAPPSTDRRGQRLRSYTTQNMVWSMLAVLVVAVAWWALMPNPEGVQRQEIAVAPVAGYAAEQAPHPVWVPVGLPEGWTPVDARYDTAVPEDTWRLGLVPPSNAYVVLEQAPTGPEALLERWLDDAERTGEQEITGPDGPQTWQLWEGSAGFALVLPGQGFTTVVRGTAGLPELVELVEALEPVD